MALTPNPVPYIVGKGKEQMKLDDFVLDSYLMHIETQECKRCGNVECISRLFEVWVNSRLVHSTGQRHLKATKELKEGYEINHSTLAPKDTPICSECILTYTTDENKRPTPVSQEEWARTLRRKYAPEEKKPAQPKQAKPVPTLDDL